MGGIYISIRKILLLTLTFLIITLMLPNNSEQILISSSIPNPTNGRLISHGNIILAPNVTSYKPVGACYSTIVNMTVINNSTAIQFINFQSFFILIILPNQPVANSTNTSFFSPSNTITTVDLFPSIPILMRISFSRICLPVGTNPATDIQLVYFDGSNFASWLPTFGAGNTITWN